LSRPQIAALHPPFELGPKPDEFELCCIALDGRVGRGDVHGDLPKIFELAFRLFGCSAIGAVPVPSRPMPDSFAPP
jgi:hypothetical protein